MKNVVGSLRGERGWGDVYRRLLAGPGSRAQRANGGLTLESIEAFVTAVVRCTVARTLPGLAVRLVETLVRKTYHGSPSGTSQPTRALLQTDVVGGWASLTPNRRPSLRPGRHVLASPGWTSGSADKSCTRTHGA